MSKERHPNIQAVAVTTDLFYSVIENLRGPAGEDLKKNGLGNFEFIKNNITRFVAELSAELDKKFES
jgi:hypothetical protein